MVTVAVMNPKGGVGKTCTTYALCRALAGRGCRVLAVDADHQGGLSAYPGFDIGNDGMTLCDVISEPSPSCVESLHWVQEGFALIPASNKLFRMADALDRMAQKDSLKKALEIFEDKFDYCIIDCPPNSGIMCRYALVAAQKVIIPTDTNMLSLVGHSIPLLQSMISSARETDNPELTVDGILVTFRGRADSMGIEDGRLQQYSQALGTKVYSSSIRWDPDLSDFNRLNRNYFDEVPGGAAVKDYEAFVEEFLGD